MASIVSAGTTSATALNMSADTTGILQLASNNGTVGLTLNTSQNVGIGTTSPGYKLVTAQASGDLITSMQGAVKTWNIRNQADGTFGYFDDSLGYWRYYYDTSNNHIWFNGSSTERMRIDSLGNVGIGMTPTNFGNGYTVLQVANATNGGMLYLTTTANVGGRIYGNSAGLTYDLLGSTSHLFNNNVAVFNASPSSTQQGILFRNTFNVGASIFSTGAATNNGFINWVGGNGTQGSIVGNGSGVSYNTTSDYRLKENVAPMTSALATVAKLKPVTYNWKVDGADGQGFIAHELQSVFPDAVSGTKDGVDSEGNPEYQGIDTSYLVATLTAAIQELNAKVTALEEQVLNLGVK